MSRPNASLMLLAVAACTGQIAEGSGTDPTDAPAPRSPGAAPMGGRVPEGSRSPTTGGDPSAPAAPGSCAPVAARIWKLTPEQLARTVAAILPGASVATGALGATLVVAEGAFQNDAHPRDMSLPHVEQLFATATDLARYGLSAPERAAPCLKSRPWPSDCVRTSIASFGGRAFRRPLSPAEIDAYAGHYTSEAQLHGPDVALRQVLRAMFLSPHFLYRTELGDLASADGTTKLTAFERASALSYLIANGPPDPPLQAAADRNELGTTSELAAHARRLLSAPATARGLLAFFEEHLALDRVAAASKDAKRFPRWSAQVAAEMAAETSAFVEHVLWKEDARLATLLTLDRSLLNARLASVYGLPSITGDGLRPVTLPPGRVGLLSHGSFLAAVAGPTESDAVRRGRTVRERFLCLPTPEPPPELANVVIPPPVDGKSTARQRLSRHSADAVCSSCHALIDPPGLALETFDAVGRLRAEDGGQPIDPRGTLVGLATGPASFRDATELASVVARAPEATACLSARLFAYGNGRRPGPADACAIADLQATFRASGGDIRKLVVDLVTSDGFVTRVR